MPVPRVENGQDPGPEIVTVSGAFGTGHNGASFRINSPTQPCPGYADRGCSSRNPPSVRSRCRHPRTREPHRSCCRCWRRIVMPLGGPKAKAGHVPGHQNCVLCPEIVRYTDPLTHVAVGWIAGAGVRRVMAAASFSNGWMISSAGSSAAREPRLLSMVIETAAYTAWVTEPIVQAEERYRCYRQIRDCAALRCRSCKQGGRSPGTAGHCPRTYLWMGCVWTGWMLARRLLPRWCGTIDYGGA